MKLYTSYFAKMRFLPKDIFPVAVSITVPHNLHVARCVYLCPGDKDLHDFRNGVMSWSEYKDRYLTYLNTIDPEGLYHYLKTLTGGKDVCLLCWENNDKPCHRHILADWFTQQGYPCKEYDFKR